MEQPKDISSEFTKYEKEIIEKLRAILKTDPVYRDVCVVGGWVRDKLKGSSSHDLDISFPEEMQNILLNAMSINFMLPETIHQNDTTVSIIQEKPAFWIDQEPLKGFKVNCFEIADISRRHHYKMDLRALKGDTIESDFYSRDFTINAIYYDIRDDVIRDPGNVGSLGIPRFEKQHPTNCFQSSWNFWE